MSISPDITIAITSCGRPHLLKKTIRSLGNMVDLTTYKKILTEDSTDKKNIKKIKEEQVSGYLKGRTVLYTGGSHQDTSFASHHCALQALYSRIDTPYVFHCEDDRYFGPCTHNYFLYAKNILHTQNHIGIICMRDFWKKNIYNLCTPKHLVTKQLFLGDQQVYEGLKYHVYAYSDEVQSKQATYNGFTLNPGLRRTQQMKDIMFGYEAYVDEKAIGKRYKKLGLRTLNTNPPICYHIGDHIHSTYFFEHGITKSLYRAIKNMWKLYVGG